MYNRLLEKIRGISKVTGALFFEEENSGKNVEPEKILKSVFGYDSFRPLQKDVIKNILEGKDTLAVMPTGGGKSLCYQIPALIFNGLTVVISPLIALMQDQVHQLNSVGVEAVYLNSSLDWDKYRLTCDKVRRGAVKLLYIAPESLSTGKIKNLLSESNIEVQCITIDEAHCISEWGHDFRPDYMEIANFRKLFPKAVCLALTATATKQVRDDIVKNLRMERPEILISSFNRPNIFLQVARKINPLDQVLSFIENHLDESGIIYCFSRRQVDELANALYSKGLKVLNYHAGLTDQQRMNNQTAFIQDKVNIMVATVAFGMGINKPDVRYVIHYDMPKSIEQYYQEIGRAGRDGLPAEALLLFSASDTNRIRYFFKDVEDKVKAEKLLQGMVLYSQSSSCRRQQLLSYFGETYDSSKLVTDAEKNCCCDICATVKRSVLPSHILIKKSSAENAVKTTIKSFPKRSSVKTDVPKDDEGKAMADALRSWRKKIAEELNVPPYVIFGDKTLYDIAAKKPKTNKELTGCYGIGVAKAERYGYEILKTLRSVCNNS